MFSVGVHGGVVAIWDVRPGWGGRGQVGNKRVLGLVTKAWCIDWNWTQGPGDLRYWVSSRKDTKLEKPREEIEVWEQITKSPVLEFGEKAWGQTLGKVQGVQTDCVVDVPLVQWGEETSFERKSKASLLRDALTGLKNTDLCSKQAVLLMS